MQEKAESFIDKVEPKVDRLTKDTKDSMQHLYKVVTELTSRISLLKGALNAGGSNNHIASLQNLRALKLHCYDGVRDAKELKNFFQR